jgi:hydrophobic/amphiphilic exporter-1 (mainly G- bacteria), HAE1 family
VNQVGIDVKKSLTSPMLLISIYSPNGTHDAKWLSNFGYINLKEPIARAYGVGQTQIFGIGEYAMRIWVKPDQLAKLGVTVNEVANAVQAQNTVPTPCKRWMVCESSWRILRRVSHLTLTTRSR